jgi:uncharacterized protein YdaU (DUF1376 family)
MKFYKRFPGDITIKTGDLSLIEFGAYDRLLDHYYAKEQPIAPDRAYTVARCQTAADRKAVDRVLAEYWTLTDEGWVQERADEMIAEALPKIEAARANGLKGGRPKKNPTGTQQKPTGFSKETQTEPKSKTSQSQSFTPSEIKRRERVTAPPPEPVTVTELVEVGFPLEVAAEFIACKASRGAPLTKRAWQDHVREAEKAGWTPLQAAEKVMGKTWKGFEAKYVAGEGKPAQTLSFRERDAQLAQEQARRWMGSAAPRTTPDNVIDMEAANARLSMG